MPLGESSEYAGIMGRVTDTPFATRTLTEAAGSPPEVGDGDGDVAKSEAAEPAADAAALAWAARNKAKLQKKKQQK